ncbi:MAG: MopE-related protein [Minicystis sp.]
MRATILAGLAAAALGAMAPLISGCKTDAFCWTCGQSATSSGTGGTMSSSSSSGAGGEGGLLFNDGGPGGSDAGDAGDASDACTADTQNDPKNCGSCGNVCDLLGAFPKCVSGSCVIDTCAPGHYDINGITSDGCEYGCTKTNGGVEICDGKDNNCDGAIDEGFDLQHDPNNCGSCGNVCSLANATATCTPVMGVPTCVVATCADGYGDIDKLGQNGCEYQCPVWPATAEVCNDKDDNCDGQVNEGNPGGGVACESNCPGGTCLGECTAGATLCAGTTLICVGGQGPTLEVCDGKDNNCDGVIDDGFDLMNDPLNCGSCGHVCTAQNAIGGCQGGNCVITTCKPGYANLDGNASNGCEYTCPVNPPTIESCNGLDDDCNGVVDDAAVIAAQKPATSGCLPTPGTPCAGADFVCQGSKGWRCNYGPGVEVDANGKLAIVETKCDGLDGNCNGQVDEAFTDLNTACDNGLLGACRDVGKRICDPANNQQTISRSLLPARSRARRAHGRDVQRHRRRLQRADRRRHRRRRGDDHRGHEDVLHRSLRGLAPRRDRDLAGLQRGAPLREPGRPAVDLHHAGGGRRGLRGDGRAAVHGRRDPGGVRDGRGQRLPLRDELPAADLQRPRLRRHAGRLQRRRPAADRERRHVQDGERHLRPVGQRGRVDELGHGQHGRAAEPRHLHGQGRILQDARPRPDLPVHAQRLRVQRDPARAGLPLLPRLI